MLALPALLILVRPCACEPMLERAVWCEHLFYSSRFASIEAAALGDGLDGLAHAQTGLHQAIDIDRLRSEPALESKLLRFLRQADRLKIPTKAWIILPKALGYWSSDENPEETALRCRQTMDWIVARGLRCRWLVIDLEPSLAFNEAAADLIKQSRYLELAILLARNIDPVGSARARQIYARLVAEIHRRGFRVLCVTYPQILDGLKLHTTFLEDVLNVPTSHVPWDRVSFMVYRTVFSDYVGEDLGPALVRGYGEDARRFFGPEAAIDVGVVGDRFYGDPALLAEDEQALVDAGLARLHVFYLEGMLTGGGVRKWLDAHRASKQADSARDPAPRARNHPLTLQVVRGALALVDRVLCGLRGR